MTHEHEGDDRSLEHCSLTFAEIGASLNKQGSDSTTTSPPLISLDLVYRLAAHDVEWGDDAQMGGPAFLLSSDFSEQNSQNQRRAIAMGGIDLLSSSHFVLVF